MHYQIYNMRLQMRSVETTNLKESLDFSAPSAMIFNDEKTGKKVQDGFRDYKDQQGNDLLGNIGTSESLKHAIF